MLKRSPTMRPRDLTIADVQGLIPTFRVTVNQNRYDNYDVSSGSPQSTLEDCMFNQIPWAIRWIMEGQAPIQSWSDNASWIVVEGRRTTRITITKRNNQYIARIRTAQEDRYIGPSSNASQIVESALYEVVYADHRPRTNRTIPNSPALH
jgi:hypothetical protein